MIQQLKSTLPDEVAARHIWCLQVMLSLSLNYGSTIKCCVIFNFLDEVFIKHRPIAHPKYISHDFRRIRCYPRSTPTFFIPIHIRIAWLWLATAPCPFYIVKATVVSFLLMLRDLLILPFSSTSTLLPSFVKHAQTAKKQVCWHLYIYFMRLFIFMNSLRLLKMPTDSTSTLLASSMLWSTPLLTKQPLLLSDWTKNWSISHYAL